MKPLGLGVLGLGEGRSIISAGVHSELWNVVCLCDTNAALAQERCAEFGLTNYTTDYDTMLADPAIDVVGIYTPDHLHAEHVIRALDAGKHVICTKPFIDNLARAADVLAAQARSGKQVMVGQSTRFFAPFIRQRQHYESGALGELATVEAAYNADHRWFLKKPWARQPAFKWLYGGISHPADLVRWYLPDIVEVMGYAYLSNNGRAGGLVNPDTYHFVLKAADGRIARVTGVYSCPTVPAGARQRDDLHPALRRRRQPGRLPRAALRLEDRRPGGHRIVRIQARLLLPLWRRQPPCRRVSELHRILCPLCRGRGNAQARRPRGHRHRRA